MWFKKFLYFFVVKLGIYTAWSKFYQIFIEKSLKTEHLPENMTPDEILSFINLIEWQPDGAKELYDAFHSEHYVDSVIVQIILANKVDIMWFLCMRNSWKLILSRCEKGLGQIAGSMDCDDYAIWCKHHLADGYKPQILNVVWTGEKFIEGHNVCIYQINNTLYHIGNWGIFGPYDSIKQIAKTICGNNKLIGYSIIKL